MFIFQPGRRQVYKVRYAPCCQHRQPCSSYTKNQLESRNPPHEPRNQPSTPRSYAFPHSVTPRETHPIGTGKRETVTDVGARCARVAVGSIWIVGQSLVGWKVPQHLGHPDPDHVCWTRCESCARELGAFGFCCTKSVMCKIIVDQKA